MKPLIVIGWILLALEALFVVMLAVTKNVGDDAAGRGMATGFAIVLGPIVLVAAGLFYWGTRGGPAIAFWIGLVMAGAPVIFGVLNLAGGAFTDFARARGRAQYGTFDDQALTTLARAIDANDLPLMRKLLATSTPDWRARDHRDQTILGHAVVKAATDYSGTTRVEAVRLLLDANAPALPNIIAPVRTPASVSEHDVVYHLFALHTPSALAVLDLLLTAGLSPNAVDEDDRPIFTSTYAGVAGLEVLAKHGADFTLLDPREDRYKYNALMNAVYLKVWPEARYFLERGLSPDDTAPDGQSARTILARVDPPGSVYYGPEDTTHAAFVAAWHRLALKK